MKPLNVAISLAVLALPLSAAAQDNNANTTTTVLSQPGVVQTTDSPLVRAAKASGRLNKKPSTIVITNETLLRTGGHFSTTDVTTQLPPLSTSLSTEESIMNEKAQAVAKAQRDAAAARLQRLRNDPEEFFRESLEPRGQKPVAAQTAISQPAVITTTQLPQATNGQPNQGSTYQPAQMSTSQPNQMTPAQPEQSTTTKPPE